MIVTTIQTLYWRFSYYDKHDVTVLLWYDLQLILSHPFSGHLCRSSSSGRRCSPACRVRGHVLGPVHRSRHGSYPPEIVVVVELFIAFV